MSDDDSTFELTRRRALGALGTIGVASAGAGLGTSAYFSDTETFENNTLTAGELDMKAATSTFYSDWLGDEEGTATMPGPEEDAELVLPAGPDNPNARDIRLAFSDVEAFLDATLQDEYNGGVQASLLPDDSDVEATPIDLCGEGNDVDEQVAVDLADVKPGDFGFLAVRFQLCDNPGFVWLRTDDVTASENGVTEPEADDPQETDGVVELLDEIRVAYDVLDDLGETGSAEQFESPFGGDTPGTPFNPANSDDQGPISLREFLDATAYTGADDDVGQLLPGDIPASEGGGMSETNCFSGVGDESPFDSHVLVLFWWLPIDHGNQVQTDSVEFDLGFYTEQCRHNDGSGQSAEGVAVLESDPAAGVRDLEPPEPWLSAVVDSGPTTTITVDLNGDVYGGGDSGTGEWPNNPTNYVVEAVVDVDSDGLGEGQSDDVRVGFGGSGTTQRSGQGSAGGYVRRNTGSGSPNRTDTPAEDVSGVSVTESGDQLSYTFEVDWTSGDLPDLSSPPSSIVVSEVYASDGGEGVAATPNNSNDGRGSIDNTTDGSGELDTGL